MKYCTWSIVFVIIKWRISILSQFDARTNSCFNFLLWKHFFLPTGSEEVDMESLFQHSRPEEFTGVYLVNLGILGREGLNVILWVFFLLSFLSYMFSALTLFLNSFNFSSIMYLVDLCHNPSIPKWRQPPSHDQVHTWG